MINVQCSIPLRIRFGDYVKIGMLNFVEIRGSRLTCVYGRSEWPPRSQPIVKTRSKTRALVLRLFAERLDLE